MLPRTLLCRSLFPVFIFTCLLPTLIEAQAVSTARPLIVERVDENSLTTLKGNTRPEARAQYDRGPVAASMPMRNLVLVLRRSPEREAAAAAFAATQSDPQSPNYHQWLTPEQVGERFGAAQSDIDAITRWLQNHGFSVDDLSKNHLTIRFSGTASQVQEAFHTEIHNLDVNGAKHIANMSDPQIPSALAPAVVGVQALHNFYPRPLHRMGGTARLNKQTGGWERISPVPSLAVSAPQAGKSAESHSISMRPEFGINLGGGGFEEDVTPYDFATIYNVAPLWSASPAIDGTNQTIAIVGTSNINPADIASFRSAFGLPAYSAPTGSTPGISIIIPPNTTDPGDCSNAASSCINDLVENSLDVEWSGAIAKNASIILVPTTSTGSNDPIYNSADYIVQNKIAPIMNVSYGECELALGTAGNSGYNTLWQTAAMEGIAVFVATGDSGSPSCDQDQATTVPYGAEFGLSVSGVASTPYNTAVGGTDFNWNSTANSQENYWNTTNNPTTLANALGYIPEVPWNDTCANPIVVAQINSELTPVGNLNAAEMCNEIATEEIQADPADEEGFLGLVNTVGGSGGKSSCINGDGQNPASCSQGYPKPSWQAGVTGIPADGARDIPDVSFFASNGFLNSAYLICVSAVGSCTYSDTAEPIAQEVGGTSVASPIMAAVMALINQKTGVSQGSPNAELYKLASTENYSSCSSETATASGSCIFNDVDSGTNTMPCAAGSPDCALNSSTDSIGILSATNKVNAPSYNAAAGYDLATGLGSANVANLVNNYAGGVTAASSATATPSSLSFTNVAVTTTSALNFTVKNTGNVVISFTGVSISGANASLFTETDNCKTAIPVDSTCTITVTFAPTAVGSFSASLAVTGSAAGTSQNLALSGMAVPAVPKASFNPTSVAFTGTPVGTTAQQTITLTSAGNVPLIVTGVTVGGTNASLFGSSSNCASVAVNATCTITVTFSPTATGSFSGTVSVADNASNSPQVIAVTGAAVPAVPGATFAPTAVTFANTNVGASSSQPITVTSSGNVPLVVASVAVGGTNASLFTQTNNCATVAVGSTCTITATFMPTAVGSFTAAISVMDNVTGSPQTITLSGNATAVPATYSLSASTANPASVAPGGSAMSTVTVTPAGGYTGTISLKCSVSTIPGGTAPPTCSLGSTGSIVVAASSTPPTATVTFNTTASSTTSSVKRASQTAKVAGWASGAALGCVLLLGIPARRRKWRSLLGMLILIAGLGTLAACGGGGSSTPPPVTNPGTTTGTYAVTVTAVDGSGNMPTNTSPVTFPVTVN